MSAHPSFPDTPRISRPEYLTTETTDKQEPELEHFSSPLPAPSTDSSAQRLHAYPLALLVVTAWACLVALLLIVLELAARRSPRYVHLPWYYDWLPTVALTIFSQAHGPITTMFIARISVSNLHHPGRAPKTWHELFDQADKAWSSPVYIALWPFKRSPRLSSLFVIFILQSLIAMATPILLSRAYPVQAIEVATRTSLNLDLFTPSLLEGLDAYTQISVGAGGMTSGDSILDLYNSTIYLPSNASLGTSLPYDLFIAGSTQGTDAIVDGLRIQGRCLQVTNVTNPRDIEELCSPLSSQEGQRWPLQTSPNTNPQAPNITTAACANISLWSPIWSEPASGRLYFNSSMPLNTDPAANTTRLPSINFTAACDAVVTGIRVPVNGRAGTFDPDLVRLGSPPKGNGGEAPMPPLLVALGTLASSAGVVSPGTVTDQMSSTFVQQWGYQHGPPDTDQGIGTYISPNVTTLVEMIWSATLHMTAALVITSLSTQKTDVIAYSTISARVRSLRWAYAAWFFIGAWLLLFILEAALLYRKTFGPSLNGYVAARILAQRPDLVKGSPCGDASDNKRLNEGFDAIGDGAETRSVGRIVPGGKGKLQVASGQVYS